MVKKPLHSKRPEILPFHDSQINFYTHYEASFVFTHLRPTLHVTLPPRIVRSPGEDEDASIFFAFKLYSKQCSFK